MAAALDIGDISTSSKKQPAEHEQNSWWHACITTTAYTAGVPLAAVSYNGAGWAMGAVFWVLARPHTQCAHRLPHRAPSSFPRCTPTADPVACAPCVAQVPHPFPCRTCRTGLLHRPLLVQRAADHTVHPGRDVARRARHVPGHHARCLWQAWLVPHQRLAGPATAYKSVWLAQPFHTNTSSTPHQRSHRHAQHDLYISPLYLPSYRSSAISS